jgi:flagellar motor switch protein FliM
MGEDVLSQAEVECLLSAIASGGEAAAGLAAAAGPAARPAAASKGIRAQITPYDFKRPERVGKEQMRALQTLHEGFSRNFSAGLSAMLRSVVEVKLAGVDQLTYSEFVLGRENPTCLNLLSAEPLAGRLILEINPSILYPIIDRLLGGGHEPSPQARRPLTQIERLLVRRITDLFLAELVQAWRNVIELTLEVVRVESTPQLVQIVPPNEVVVLVRFEIALGETHGMLNLCIPCKAMEGISDRLSASRWVACGQRKASEESVQQIGRVLRSSPLEIKVRLARTSISTKELIALQVGDIITTQKDIRSPMLVTVEGVPKFRAMAGSFKGHKAFQVVEVIDDPSSAACQ